MERIEFIVGCIVGIVLGSIIGVFSVLYAGITSIKPITPEITIKCTNSICDTTYVYRSK